MQNISIIGIGKLGLCFALTLEKSGYSVLGCDIRKDYIKSVNNKTFKTIEPDVEKYLKKSRNFKVTTNLEEIINFSNIIFIIVRTTSEPNGKYDCSQVDRVINDIRKLGPTKNIKNIIISCNVNPGYSDEVQQKLKNYNYIISYNPEWIAQGSIIHDQLFPDVVVIGEDNEKSGNIIENIYKKICISNPSIHHMDKLSAEITKISLNCCLTAKISLANMIGDLAIKSGVDPDKILNAIGEDSRIGNKYIKYGFGYGGPCFSRDVRAFIKYATDLNIKPSMIIAADEINKNHLEFQISQFIKNHNIADPVILNSVTYKKGVIIIEESQQLLFARKLAENGYKIIIKECSDVICQVKEIYSDLFTYQEKCNYEK